MCCYSKKISVKFFKTPVFFTQLKIIYEISNLCVCVCVCVCVCAAAAAAAAAAA